MSAVRAIEPWLADQTVADVSPASTAERHLRLVRGATGQDDSARELPGRSRSGPRASSTAAAGRRGAGEVIVPAAVIAPRSTPAAGTLPLRLTRRGRMVTGAFVIVVTAAIALIVGLAAAGRAQAANHAQPRAGYQGMHQVAVRAGQTLWSIALRADPQADPREVVQEIMTANSLTSTNISPGEVLWVPR